jgi:hypothetical protein
MNTYNIEITRNGQYVSFDFSPNTPCLLADEIKKLVENYFKEDEK